MNEYPDLDLYATVDDDYDVDSGDDAEGLWEHLASLPMASPETMRIVEAIRGARGQA